MVSFNENHTKEVIEQLDEENSLLKNVILEVFCFDYTMKYEGCETLGFDMSPLTDKSRATIISVLLECYIKKRISDDRTTS